MRIRDRLILGIHQAASWLDGFTDRPHLTTDPVCARYRRTREGSRLDRICRGVSCTPCMIRSAFGYSPPVPVVEDSGDSA